MIQDPSKDLTLIVYNTPKPPRYIKINKGLIKALIIIIPILLIASITFSLFSSVYMKRKLEKVRSKEPEIIATLRAEKTELQAQVDSLKKGQEELTQKISSGAETISSDTLALFTTPLGYTDISDNEKAKLENITANVKEEKIVFKFDLLNNLPNEEKLSGYITIIQYADSMIEFYPQYKLSIESNRLEYSKGESFTVSRFRPVIAEFNKPNALEVWYKIYIFSRGGNLISYKLSGPYQVN